MLLATNFKCKMVLNRNSEAIKMSSAILTTIRMAIIWSTRSSGMDSKMALVLMLKPISDRVEDEAVVDSTTTSTENQAFEKKERFISITQLATKMSRLKFESS